MAGKPQKENNKTVSCLGICISYEASLSAIDRIHADFNSGAIKCQNSVEINERCEVY